MILVLVEGRQTSTEKVITLGSPSATKTCLGQTAVNKVHIGYVTEI